LYRKNRKSRRIGFGAKEVHYRDKIDVLVLEALKNGVAAMEAESGLLYIVSTSEFSPEITSSVLENLLKKFTGKPMASLLSRNSRSYLYFPIILTIQDPESVYRFYNGQISIVTIVDIGVVESKLRAQNLSINIIENDDEWTAEVIENKALIMKIGSSLWFRLYAEFISLEWFVNEIIIHVVKSKIFNIPQ
jgi:hypothetical protein